MISITLRCSAPMKIRPKALQTKTEGFDLCMTVCIQQGSFISYVRRSCALFQHMCIPLTNAEVRQESSSRLWQASLTSKDWHITYNPWHHESSVSRMVTCQAVTATEQHLAQHHCFHDSCMKTLLRLPSDIECSYKEDVVTTLWAPKKLDPPSHTLWKTVLVQNHNIREKTLARNLFQAS